MNGGFIAEAGHVGGGGVGFAGDGDRAGHAVEQDLDQDLGLAGDPLGLVERRAEGLGTPAAIGAVATEADGLAGVERFAAFAGSEFRTLESDWPVGPSAAAFFAALVEPGEQLPCPSDPASDSRTRFRGRARPEIAASRTKRVFPSVLQRGSSELRKRLGRAERSEGAGQIGRDFRSGGLERLAGRLPASRAPPGASRVQAHSADDWTLASLSFKAATRCSALSAPMPSSVQIAWTRATGGPLAASLARSGMVAGSLRSTSTRWAVSRCQALACISIFTRSSPWSAPMSILRLEFPGGTADPIDAAVAEAGLVEAAGSGAASRR